MKGTSGRRTKPRTPITSPKAKRRRPRSKPRSPAKTGKAARSRPAKTGKTAKPRVARASVRRPPPAARVRRAPSTEDDLLELARSLSAAAGETAADGGELEVALMRMENAFAGKSLLARRFFRSWLRTRDDKTATLALAWAREQVRRGLGEVLERERAQGRIRGDVSAETLSWLILAASEAMAHEPLGASRDRLAMLLEFVRPSEGS